MCLGHQTVAEPQQAAESPAQTKTNELTGEEGERPACPGTDKPPASPRVDGGPDTPKLTQGQALQVPSRYTWE